MYSRLCCLIVHTFEEVQNTRQAIQVDEPGYKPARRKDILKSNAKGALNPQTGLTCLLLQTQSAFTYFFLQRILHSRKPAGLLLVLWDQFCTGGEEAPWSWSCLLTQLQPAHRNPNVMPTTPARPAASPPPPFSSAVHISHLFKQGFHVLMMTDIILLN